MKKERGITLIALIITIILMLILVGVSVTVALNGGLFSTAKKAAQDTDKARMEEEMLAAILGVSNGNTLENDDIIGLTEKLLAIDGIEGVDNTNGSFPLTVTDKYGNQWTINRNGSLQEKTATGNSDNPQENPPTDPGDEMGGCIESSEVTLMECTQDSEGTQIILEECDTDYYDSALTEIVESINNPETILYSVSTCVNELLDNEYEIADDSDMSLEDYEQEEFDFITKFVDLVLIGGENRYTNDGVNISSNCVFTFELLRGIEADEVSNYYIMLINPETYELRFIDLDGDSSDLETGEFSVDFPSLGVFALVQKN